MKGQTPTQSPAQGIQSSWGDTSIKMQVAPRPKSSEPPKTEISLTTVIIAGIVMWLLIFGLLFSWAAFSPCSFLKFIIGQEGLKGFVDKGIDVTDTNVCRAVLRGQAG